MLIVERPELPVVDLDLIMMPGAGLDRPSHSGRVSMMAEMLDEGTRTRSALDIAAELDYLGAHLNVRPTWDSVSTSLHVLAERLEPALEVFSDVVLQPTFPDDEFRRKRTERLTSLQQDRDEPGALAAKAAAASVFGPAHPYGAPLDGTTAAITRLPRDEVENTYARHFAAGRPCLTVVGAVKPARILAQLETSFGKWRGQLPAAKVSGMEVPATSRRVLLVDKPGAAQAELRIAHPAPPRDTEDYFPIKVMNAMLGGSFTSRLNTILRERMGVTYGATSHFRLRQGGGLFSAGAAVLTEAVARSAQVVLEEMERMIAERVSANELQRAQSYMALGLPRSFETTADIAAHLREQVVHGLPDDYWATYVDRILDVTVEDVARVAACYLQPTQCSIVVVADRAQVQSALEEARLGEVRLTEVET